MSEMEEKLSSVLNNPQLMQQIFTMAQHLGNTQTKQEDTPTDNKSSSGFNLDPKLIQTIAGLAQQNGVDQNQHALLQALSPYLSRDRVSKLERAMRAARMAGAASIFLNSGGMQLLTGR